MPADPRGAAPTARVRGAPRDQTLASQEIPPRDNLIHSPGGPGTGKTEAPDEAGAGPRTRAKRMPHGAYLGPPKRGLPIHSFAEDTHMRVVTVELRSLRFRRHAALAAAVLSAAGLLLAAPCGWAQEGTMKPKTFIDYFLPTPIQAPLTSDAWGAPGVLPRDVTNGLEAVDNKWSYWDGQIIKASDGKYHMFASRWNESRGHRGWGGSAAVHAVSDSLLGPYVDKGLCWPDDQKGKGHNVTALALPDGRYAIVVSETRPGDVFVSDSLDGPWKRLGSIKVAEGEHSGLGRMSNVSIMVRPDGDFMIVARSGAVWISKQGILGPYVVQGPSVYPTVAGLPLRNLEDPVIWHSGGLYHIVVNGWSDRKAYHITSVDGITGWTLRGLAYDPRVDFVRYDDGTVNRWDKLERPGVVIEDGHVVAVTLAVLDVPKDEERGDDNHGSKVIVIPFDGAGLDADLAEAR